MENKDKRAATKAATKALREQQMDLWGEPKQDASSTASLPAEQTLSRKAGQTAETKKEPAAKVTERAAPAVPIKVTASVPSRLSVGSRDRSLPALTRRQHELLDYLRRRAERAQPPASLTEICRDLGLVSRGSLHKQVVALVEAGLVEPMAGKQRGVRLVLAANDADGAVPLLGSIAAGRPIEALTREENLSLPDWMRRDHCYALMVKGDSMRDAGILDGDYVVVEPRENARNGEMVVALIDSQEATLKRIEWRGDEVLLHAENAAYAPQRYAVERVRVQGVVIGQLRRY
jgi:repressor LexA